MSQNPPRDDADKADKADDKFRPSTMMWVHLEGHPWWPARVAEPDEIDFNVLKVSAIPSHETVAMFFNDKNRFCLIDKDRTQPFRYNDFYKIRIKGVVKPAVKGALRQAWQFIHDNKLNARYGPAPPGFTPKPPAPVLALQPDAAIVAPVDERALKGAPSVKRRRDSHPDADLADGAIPPVKRHRSASTLRIKSKLLQRKGTVSPEESIPDARSPSPRASLARQPDEREGDVARSPSSPAPRDRDDASANRHASRASRLFLSPDDVLDVSVLRKKSVTVTGRVRHLPALAGAPDLDKDSPQSAEVQRSPPRDGSDRASPHHLAVPPLRPARSDSTDRDRHSASRSDDEPDRVNARALCDDKALRGEGEGKGRAQRTDSESKSRSELSDRSDVDRNAHVRHHADTNYDNDEEEEILEGEGNLMDDDGAGAGDRRASREYDEGSRDEAADDRHSIDPHADASDEEVRRDDRSVSEHSSDPSMAPNAEYSERGSPDDNGAEASASDSQGESSSASYPALGFEDGEQVFNRKVDVPHKDLIHAFSYGSLDREDLIRLVVRRDMEIRQCEMYNWKILGRLKDVDYLTDRDAVKAKCKSAFTSGEDLYDLMKKKLDEESGLADQSPGEEATPPYNFKKMERKVVDLARDLRIIYFNIGEVILYYEIRQIVDLAMQLHGVGCYDAAAEFRDVALLWTDLYIDENGPKGWRRVVEVFKKQMEENGTVEKGQFRSPSPDYDADMDSQDGDSPPESEDVIHVARVAKDSDDDSMMRAPLEDPERRMERGRDSEGKDGFSSPAGSARHSEESVEQGKSSPVPAAHHEHREESAAVERSKKTGPDEHGWHAVRRSPGYDSAGSGEKAAEDGGEQRGSQSLSGDRRERDVERSEGGDRREREDKEGGVASDKNSDTLEKIVDDRQAPREQLDDEGKRSPTRERIFDAKGGGGEKGGGKLGDGGKESDGGGTARLKEDGGNARKPIKVEEVEVRNPKGPDESMKVDDLLTKEENIRVPERSSEDVEDEKKIVVKDNSEGGAEESKRPERVVRGKCRKMTVDGLKQVFENLTKDTNGNRVRSGRRKEMAESMEVELWNRFGGRHEDDEALMTQYKTRARMVQRAIQQLLQSLIADEGRSRLENDDTFTAFQNLMASPTLSLASTLIERIFDSVHGDDVP